MDLGISSLQLDAWERGFSYSYDAPLDMRMDPDQELERARGRQRMARAPHRRRDPRLRRGAPRAPRRARDRQPPAARTTSQLVEAIRAALPPEARFGRGHPAKRTFQGIRIAVNGELEALDLALPAAWELLRPGGRLAAISFHSLEDRRVKRFLAARATGCTCPPEIPVCVCGRTPEAELLSRRAIAPTPEEAEENPRSRSAHLRGAVKLEGGGP